MVKIINNKIEIKELPRFQNYEVGENRTEKIYVKNIAKNVSEDLFTSIFNRSKSSFGFIFFYCYF